MKLFIAITVVTVLFAAYVVWIRPWMRDKPWAQGFFAAIEPIEIALFKKSETLLKARAKMLLGLLLTLLTQIGTLDLTPLMPLVPDEWEPIVKVAFNLLPMVLTVGGWVDEKLRDDTSTPLAVVAMPMDAPPEVKAKVAEAAAANTTAVIAVETEAVKVAATEAAKA